jgi:hypothetical protein
LSADFCAALAIGSCTIFALSACIVVVLSDYFVCLYCDCFITLLLRLSHAHALFGPVAVTFLVHSLLDLFMRSSL